MERKRSYRISSEHHQECKITIVGDTAVGKTSLILTKLKKKFPSDYYPRLDGFESDLKLLLGHRSYRLTIYDYPGQDDFDQLRRSSLNKTDCVLLCYSISNKHSYENISLKWIQELRECCLKIPVILLATKCDLRGTSAEVLTQRDGEKLKNKIPEISKYMECSAFFMKGLDEIFIEAVKSVMQNSANEPEHCALQ